MKRETEREGRRWSEKEKFWELAGLRAFFFWPWVVGTGTGTGTYWHVRALPFCLALLEALPR